MDNNLFHQHKFCFHEDKDEWCHDAKERRTHLGLSLLVSYLFELQSKFSLISAETRWHHRLFLTFKQTTTTTDHRNESCGKYCNRSQIYLITVSVIIFEKVKFSSVSFQSEFNPGKGQISLRQIGDFEEIKKSKKESS